MEIVIKVPLEAFAEGDIILRLVPDTDYAAGGQSGSAPAVKINPDKVVEIYNQYAVKHKWVRCTKLGDKLRDSIKKALVNYRTEDEWHTIMRGLESDPFFSGATGTYDKTSIMTLLHAKRYEQFYDLGMASVTEITTKNDFLAELEAHHEAERLKLRDAKIAMGLIDA